MKSVKSKTSTEPWFFRTRYNRKTLAHGNLYSPTVTHQLDKQAMNKTIINYYVRWPNKHETENPDKY